MQVTPNRIRKIIFERMLGKVFFQRQTDAFRQNTLRRLIRKINQTFNERGYTPPWIYTKKECLEFWQSIDNKATSVGNRPEKYATKERGIVEVLHSFWSPQVQMEHSILELGCNAGGNLHWLDKLGYIDLRGVEINQNAIKSLHHFFPELGGKLRIYENDIETALNQMDENSVDVIFTMGVAMHIHPKDNHLFKEMMRVAKKYICTVEPETANSNYVFARNYRRVFEKIGATHLKSCLTTNRAFPQIPKPGLTLRFFAV